MFSFIHPHTSSSHNAKRLSGEDDVFYTPQQTAWVLERERSRAERTGSTFAVVVFTLENKFSRAADLKRLARFLPKRMRMTDEAGLLRENQVTLILSNTTEGGAWKVARDACSRFQPGHEPSCEVFVYPARKESTRNRPVAAERDSSDPDRRRLSRHAESPAHLFVKPLPKWKRVADVLLAGGGLLLLAPLIGVSMVVVKLTSPGPALFCQRRSGLAGKPFTMYKLRTMLVGAEQQKDELRPLSEQDGPAFKMKNDPRITSVGRYFRKTCIDELPQLWNVLRGDMSIVGPRPLPCDESEACQEWEPRRLDVTPGLTCIWQVNYDRHVPFAEWMRMDIRYIRARTMWNDLRLMLRTLIAVVSHRASH